MKLSVALLSMSASSSALDCEVWNLIVVDRVSIFRMYASVFVSALDCSEEIVILFVLNLLLYMFRNPVALSQAVGFGLPKNPRLEGT